jgi:hypothetical protein
MAKFFRPAAAALMPGYYIYTLGDDGHVQSRVNAICDDDEQAKPTCLVWRSIEHCPWQAAIADPFERRMGSEHAAQIRSAFGFGDADQLKQVSVAAGFRGVEIRVERETNRLASIAEYVPGYIRRPLSQQPLLAWIRRHKQRLPPT